MATPMLHAPMEGEEVLWVHNVPGSGLSREKRARTKRLLLLCTVLWLLVGLNLPLDFLPDHANEPVSRGEVMAAVFVAALFYFCVLWVLLVAVALRGARETYAVTSKRVVRQVSQRAWCGWCGNMVVSTHSLPLVALPPVISTMVRPDGTGIVYFAPSERWWVRLRLEGRRCIFHDVPDVQAVLDAISQAEDTGVEAAEPREVVEARVREIVDACAAQYLPAPLPSDGHVARRHGRALFRGGGGRRQGLILTGVIIGALIGAVVLSAGPLTWDNTARATLLTLLLWYVVRLLARVASSLVVTTRGVLVETAFSRRPVFFAWGDVFPLHTRVSGRFHMRRFSTMLQGGAGGLRCTLDPREVHAMMALAQLEGEGEGRAAARSHTWAVLGHEYVDMAVYWLLLILYVVSRGAAVRQHHAPSE